MGIGLGLSFSVIKKKLGWAGVLLPHPALNKSAPDLHVSFPVQSIAWNRSYSRFFISHDTGTSQKCILIGGRKVIISTWFILWKKKAEIKKQGHHC